MSAPFEPSGPSDELVHDDPAPSSLVERFMATFPFSFSLSKASPLVGSGESQPAPGPLVEVDERGIAGLEALIAGLADGGGSLEQDLDWDGEPGDVVASTIPVAEAPPEGSTEAPAAGESLETEPSASTPAVASIYALFWPDSTWAPPNAPEVPSGIEPATITPAVILDPEPETEEAIVAEPAVDVEPETEEAIFAEPAVDVEPETGPQAAVEPEAVSEVAVDPVPDPSSPSEPDLETVSPEDFDLMWLTFLESWEISEAEEAAASAVDSEAPTAAPLGPVADDTAENLGETESEGHTVLTEEFEPSRSPVDVAWQPLEVDEDDLALLAPMEDDQPVTEIDDPPRRGRHRRRRRGSRKLAAISAAVAFALLAAVFVQAARPRKAAGKPPARPAATSLPVALAWSVTQGSTSYVAGVFAPDGRVPSVVAVPAETVVDLPGGGPPMVGEAASTGPMLLAAEQATFDMRIPHYLVSSNADLQGLVDRLGGISVILDGSFDWLGQTLGPGTTHVSGTQVVAYLSAAAPEDRTAHWEAVLQGLFAAPAGSTGWAGPLGQSDDPSTVQRVLQKAVGAPVIELPTTVEEDQVNADPDAIGALLQARVGDTGPDLVRVVLVNGNGQPELGVALAVRLAPQGFRIVAAQNAPSFNVLESQVIAGDSSFEPAAEQVRSLLGVGKVMVGSQPTGIADVMIIVGKDFTAS